MVWNNTRESTNATQKETMRDVSGVERATAASRKRPLSGSGKLASKKKRTVINLNNVEVVAPPETGENKSDPAEFPVQEFRASEPQEKSRTQLQLGDQTRNGDACTASLLGQGTEPLDRGVILQEEKHIMQQLDKSILKKEEAAVMRHLMDNIHTTEDLEEVKALPSLVREVTGQLEQKMWEQHENNHSSLWKLQQRRRKQRKGMPPPLTRNGSNTYAVEETTAAVRNSVSNVMEVGQIEIKRVRQPLPKWQPSTSSPRQKLFTRPEFLKHVVSKINQELPPEILYCPQMWQVRILEEVGNDSNSYILEARGQPQYLRLLRNATETFVQDRIAYYNTHELLHDEESFIVDASVSIQAGPLGMTLLGDSYGVAASEGVWVKLFRPGSRIGQLLGGEDAYGGGCVLLSVNNTDVRDAAAAKKAILWAKEGEKLSLSKKSKIKLCLSKTANFQNSSDAAALSIRRINSDAADLSIRRNNEETCDDVRDEHVVLDKFLRETPPPPLSWVERARKDAENALTSNFPHRPPKTKKDCRIYFQSIMEDNRSVEVELVMVTAEGGFGAKIYEVPNSGLFLRSISFKKQLGKALGRTACLFGAVLWKFEGEEVRTREALNRIIEGIGDTSYSVTLVLFDGTDLSSICRDRLVRGRWNPRRRNGEPYPLHQPSGAMLARQLIQMEHSSPADTGRSKKIHADEDDSEDEFGWNGDQSKDLVSTDNHVGNKGGLNRYKAFESKYKRLARADYKDTKIHVRHVLALLWEKHKELFGSDNVCDESCRCFHSLPALSSNLIQRHMAKQKKSKQALQTEQELERRVAGVMEHFAPTFVEELEKTYPNETSSQLIDRLCDMWSFHSRVPLYGVRCSDKCECRDEWNGLFAQGDAERMEVSLTSRSIGKKRSALVAASAESSNDVGVSIPRKIAAGVESSRGDGAIIPRKKRDISSKATLPFGNAGHPSVNPKNVEPDVPRNATAQPSKRASTVQFSFELALNTSQPLGGYFTTGQTASGFTYVSIDSVLPFGQLASRNVKKGTRIEALLTGESRKPVANHTELQDQYELARRRKRPLKLIFVNMGSPPETNPKNSQWDAHGNWIGVVKAEKVGWAGGALDKSLTQRAAPIPSTSKENISPVTAKTQPENCLWTACTNERHLPDPSTPPPRSCLQKAIVRKTTGMKSKKPAGKKIKFSDSPNYVILFDKEHPTNVSLVKRETEVVENKPQGPKQTEEEILFDKIQTGSCKDLIDLFQSGFISSPHVVKTALTPNYNLLKDRIREMVVSTPATAKVKQQLEAKALVMKIFTNCAFLVAKAMALTRFFELHIEITELTMEKTMNSKQLSVSSVCSGQVALTYGDGKSFLEVLGTLPERQFAEKLAYDEGCSFTAHNNAAFGMEDRRLLIEVDEKPLQNSIPASRLGKAIFELDSLEQKCITGGPSVEATAPISAEGGAHILSHGAVKITVRKTQVGEEYISSKRMEVLKGLKVQIDNIHHFNQKWSKICATKLSGNIQGIDGLTLLHAAVHLGEMPMTKELMGLGADARQRSQLGTPLHFAQQMLEKVLEKQKFLEAKQAPEADRLRQREKVAKAKDLADMLHKTNRLEEARTNSSTLNDRSSPDASSKSAGSSGTATSTGLNSISRRSPSPADTSSTTTGANNNSQRRPSFQPNLPLLPSVVWAEFPIRGFDVCSRNMQECWHFDQGKCHFWHTVLSPLRPDEMSISPVAVPSLKSAQIRTKQHGHFWTAVYADVPTKRILYVQDTIQNGYRSDQGIWWFHSQIEAKTALEKTVAILNQQERNQRQHNHSLDRAVPPYHSQPTSNRRRSF